MDELVTVVNYLQSDEIPFLTVGNLSNVLPSEGDIPRVIVSTRKMRYEENGKGFFSAGIRSSTLLDICQKQRLSGAEFLQGIPCTLGGALYMNAGVSGRYIGEIVQSVTVLKDGEVRTLSILECGYSYKHSVFTDGKSVILGAQLALVEADSDSIQKERMAYQSRRAHLPKGKSMGCVFKNPEGKIAGKLIESAGLKGLRIGKAVVSETHANFIINEGNATASDIRTLIETIKKSVFARYKIRLEEEIIYLS